MPSSPACCPVPTLTVPHAVEYTTVHNSARPVPPQADQLNLLCCLLMQHLWHAEEATLIQHLWHAEEATLPTDVPAG